MNQRCREGYHEWETEYSNDECVREVCVRCGKILVSKLKMNIDQNKEYLNEHKRDVLQPSNPIFEQEYGKPKL